METLRGELRKEHAEKDQLREKFADKEDQLRKRLAERDQLREKLAKKDTHINSYLEEISDLQQQLKVTPFFIHYPHRSLDMLIPFQLAEMNAESLLQYKQLAELQETSMERAREKIAIELELMVATG